jgi:phage terminase large subunit
MSAKGKGLARVTHLIIDEATELPSYEEYIKVIDTFRVKDAERKIFVVFNPTSKLHWIHKVFYIDGQPNPKWLVDHCFIHTTYKDNINNLDPSKIAEWERMKDTDPEYYEHHILGLWRDAYLGRIYKNWNFDYEPPEDAEVFWGLDFGFSSDPTAVIEVKKKANEIWIRQILYSTNLTNEDIHRVLTKKGLDERSQIIAESAEPKSIEELRRLGFKRIAPAIKGPGSVISGIKRVASLVVHCDPHSQDLLNEYNSYIWKVDSDVPQDKNNHLLDSLRYALSHDRPSGQYASASGAAVRKYKNQLETEMYS